MSKIIDAQTETIEERIYLEKDRDYTPDPLFFHCVGTHEQSDCYGHAYIVANTIKDARRLYDRTGGSLKDIEQISNLPKFDPWGKPALVIDESYRR